jgi:hypothetical protein
MYVKHRRFKNAKNENGADFADDFEFLLSIA